MLLESLENINTNPSAVEAATKKKVNPFINARKFIRSIDVTCFIVVAIKYVLSQTAIEALRLKRLWHMQKHDTVRGIYKVLEMNAQHSFHCETIFQF